MCQPHAAQHVWRFSKLDVVVADNFYAVAPGIEKVKKRPRKGLDPRIAQRFTDRILVVDHKSKMAPVVSRLSASLLQCEELVTQINESSSGVLAAKIEIEQL